MYVTVIVRILGSSRLGDGLTETPSLGKLGVVCLVNSDQKEHTTRGSASPGSRAAGLPGRPTIPHSLPAGTHRQPGLSLRYLLPTVACCLAALTTPRFRW